MALRVLATPYDDFWENQNQKLLARSEFIKEKGNIFDDVWHFRHRNGSTQIDFSIFDLQHIRIENAAKVVVDGQEYPLSTKEYAKLFFLETMPKKGLFGIYAIEKMITHIFAFLNAWQSPLENGKYLTLEASHLEDFWISFLVQSVNENGFFNLVSAPNYKGYIKPLSLPLIRNRLKALGISGVIGHDIAPSAIKVALDEACQSQLNIKLNEYKEGGDFNFLGLELGQYYIDYLRRVYQQDYLYTLCCKGAIDKFYFKYDLNHMESKGRSTLLKVIQFALTDKKFTPPASFKRSRGAQTKGVQHRSLFYGVKDEAYNEYLENYDAAMSLNEEIIEELVIKLGLNMRFDAVEIVRILMLQKFSVLKGGKPPERVWNDYLTSLDKTFLESKNLMDVNVDDIYNEMHTFIETKKLDKNAFLTELVKFGKKLRERSNQDDYKSFKSELYKTVHVMTNLVVAWLGYRQSEFGFPFNAIHVEPNLDILDNSHVPFRFKLKWFVPKTNGGTKLNREITSQSYQIAAQLNNFFDASESEPCLYKSSTSGNVVKNETPNISGHFITERVRANWKRFVSEYQPFKDVLRLEALANEKDTLNEQSLDEIKYLNQAYNINSARYNHLLKAAKKVKEDWKCLSCTIFNGTLAQKKFKESIQTYVGTGRTKNIVHQRVIDSCLSEKTRNLLLSGNVLLDQKTMFDINSEIKNECKYPSPHAMRHIWAEAVLTRYGGDTGAVIRHQFCHLDSSFFSAYLQGKDARGLYKGAKQRYLNSIVEMLINNSDKVGLEYLGGFSRFVKKAIGRTNTLSSDDLRVLRDAINGRVISIQPSPFATCIPRDGSEQRAKCARFGSINPQDAKPEFCLNCTNALITSGNLRGIWTTIQPMIKESLDKNTMGFMVGEHLPTLRSGYKRIKAFHSGYPNQEAVVKILKAIETAINCIESKLETEEINYG